MINTYVCFEVRFEVMQQALKDGLFTPPVPLGSRSVGWPAYEVEAINTARIAGKSDAEIRALVAELEAKRKA
jgi:prophage regulatory protein